MQQELRLVLSDAAEAASDPEPRAPLDLVTATSNGVSTWGRDDIYGNDGR